MSFGLEDKTAVVTGAGSGIGSGVAEAFVAEGAHVVVVDYDAGAGTALVERLTAAGGTASVQVCDVRDSAAVRATFAAIEGQRGAIDVLVCSAGVREIAHPLEIDPGVWDNTLAVDLSGTFYCCQAAAQAMDRRRRGAIVAIASVNALVGEALRPAYCAAKHGVLGLVRSLAHDLASSNIRVNAVCPGVIRTPLTEPYFSDPGFAEDLGRTVALGRAGEPSDIANAVLFLASERARYVTGTSLVVDGGFLAEKRFAYGADSAYLR